MLKFIIDANLPEHLSIWSGEVFIHVNSINKSWKDSEIWVYAKERNLTILSKDSDFGNRILLVAPPPKVIHFRTGNMLFEEFKEFLNHNWEAISRLSDNHKLVKVFSKYIEAIQ
jgi:predicted nuclease of predicted toxin-antitoxin system